MKKILILFYLDLIFSGISDDDLTNNLDALKIANTYYSEAILTYYGKIAELFKNQELSYSLNFEIADKIYTAKKLCDCLIYFNQFIKNLVNEILIKKYENIDFSDLKTTLDTLSTYLDDSVHENITSLSKSITICNNLACELIKINCIDIKPDETYFSAYDSAIEYWGEILALINSDLDVYFSKIKILMLKRNELVEKRMRLAIK